MSLLAIGVCLVLVADPRTGPVFVPARRFTLAWTHSIEKVRWEEDYAVEPGQRVGGAPELRAVAARVRGSGAGMEPPPDAVLRDGWYEYRPGQSRHEALLLTRSRYVPDYEFCTAAAGCRSMTVLLPSDGGVTRMTPCKDPGR